MKREDIQFLLERPTLESSAEGLLVGAIKYEELGQYSLAQMEYTRASRLLKRNTNERLCLDSKIVEMEERARK
ncbi:MAG: hypothetical protein KKC19_00265 [Nanoarchaeota archaeon]|nr:hypothetical protein [Nanoarchaeota archaeon]